MPKSGQVWNPSYLFGHDLFAIFEPLAAPLRTPTWPSLDELTHLNEEARLLHAPECAPLRFRAAPKRSRRERRTCVRLDDLYDGSISLNGEVPCLNESYHDLFNALIFAAFPRSKRLLHRRQHLAQTRWLERVGIDPSRPRLPGRRSREQDALTIFDEGGALLAFTNETLQDWSCWTEAKPIEALGGAQKGRIVLFGHALLEHLFEGQKTFRASGIALKSPEPLAGPLLLPNLDRALAARLSNSHEFLEPGADGIVSLRVDGSLWLSPPKPSWREPLPLQLSVGADIPPSPRSEPSSAQLHATWTAQAKQ